MDEYADLIAKLRYLARIYSICENENTNEYKLAVQAADAIEKLKDRVIVRHGQWVEDDISGIIKCSLCDSDAPMETTSGQQYKSSYCQTCGAIMGW